MEAVGGASVFSVGGIRYDVMSDGEAGYPPAVFFPNVPPDEVAETLGNSLTGEGLLVTPYNCGLIESGGQLVLLDAGMGPIAAEVGAPAGRLLASLRDRGIGPDDIDVVVISHAHLDHIGGLVKNGAARFAKARHLLAREEWEFWMSEECERRLSGEYADTMIGAARGHLPMLSEAGLLELVEGQTTVIAGVELIPAPGHTPGHMIVAVSAGEDSVMYLADAFLHELNLPHPDWISTIDVDPELTVTTRVELFDRAAADGSIVAAFHVGTASRIEKSADAYRFTDAPKLRTKQNQ